MNCPFCRKPLDDLKLKCPHCSKSVRFTAEAAKRAEETRSKGEEAEKRRDYRGAIAAYRAALRFRDSDELKNRICLLETKVNQRQIMMRTLFIGGLVTALTGVLIIVALTSASAKTVINSVSVTTIEPSRRSAHLAREAYNRQDWPLALKVLGKLARDPDWGWVAQARFDEAKSRYVIAMVDQALKRKKDGDSDTYRRILVELAWLKFDDSRETVFRLRRAEGLAMFEDLTRKSPGEQAKVLGEIIGLFRPDELKRVYYADDCIFRLAVAKAEAGDETGAKANFTLLKERCPQGKWYWSAADAYLARH